ncbi:MAG: hypothetical protein JEZ07_20350 [Phycisphaerae bacterium]|nr:hypothetical protein [Phycisphaerae bacterium]
MFSEKEARDIYYNLIMGKFDTVYQVRAPLISYEKDGVISYKWDFNDVGSKKYERKEYQYEGSISWSVVLNIYRGLELMIKNHDQRIEDISVYLLSRLPYNVETREFPSLSQGGWDSHYYQKEYAVLMTDSKYRCRMVIMRYVRQLKCRKAIPVLEKLLNSSHPDERDFALATLEEITSGGGNASSNSSEISEEEKYDNIVLRNGDKISGQVMNASLHLKTSYGSLEFKTSTMAYIKFEGADSKTDAMELRNGDKLTGNLNDETFTINMKAGQIIPVKKKDISSITFRRVWKRENDEK